MGHRLFDLGNLAVNNEFDDDAQERLLEAYFGEPPTPGRRAALRLMMLVSDAREAAWGVVQGSRSPSSTSTSPSTPSSTSRGWSEAPRIPAWRSGLMARPRELPDRARVVIIGGGVGGASIAYHLAAAGRARRRPARSQRAHQRFDVSLRRAGRPAARQRLADPDDDGLGGALPPARLRLGGVRRDPPGVQRGARAGGPAPGGVVKDVRPAAGAAVARRGPGAVPADGHRRRPLRVLSADRRLSRSVAADLRADRGRPRAAAAACSRTRA